VALMPAWEFKGSQEGQNHVVFPENFLDELRHKVPCAVIGIIRDQRSVVVIRGGSPRRSGAANKGYEMDRGYEISFRIEITFPCLLQDEAL
jgi:hypothetical protein